MRTLGNAITNAGTLYVSPDLPTSGATVCLIFRDCECVPAVQMSKELDEHDRENVTAARWPVSIGARRLRRHADETAVAMVTLTVTLKASCSDG